MYKILFLIFICNASARILIETVDSSKIAWKVTARPENDESDLDFFGLKKSTLINGILTENGSVAMVGRLKGAGLGDHFRVVESKTWSEGVFLLAKGAELKLLERKMGRADYSDISSGVMQKRWRLAARQKDGKWKLKIIIAHFILTKEGSDAASRNFEAGAYWVIEGS